jgi:membrane associated rhomboid family serine protease
LRITDKILTVKVELGAPTNAGHRGAPRAVHQQQDQMAVVAFRRLQLSDFYELAPYAIAFAVVPTLACAAGREPLPPWPVLPLTHEQLLANFTFRQEQSLLTNFTFTQSSRKKWWTLLTSAFCHADAAHRDRNLVNLLLCGLQLAPDLGRSGLAITFLGGHVAAALNGRGLRLQLENFLEAQTGRMAPQWLSGKAAEIWTKSAPPTVLGGSAGLFALLGVDCCLKVRDAVEMLRGWDVHGEPPAGELLWLVLHAAPVASLVLSEIQSFRSGSSVSVGHAAHLTGFAWGVGCYLVRAAWRRMRAARNGLGGTRTQAGARAGGSLDAARRAPGNFGAGNGRRLGGTAPPPWNRDR